MSYFKLTRKELAQKLADQRSTIDYVNPSDKHSWRNTYLVGLNQGVYWLAMFLVHASTEQDAIDEIADYCEEHRPHLFAEEEYLAELRADALAAGYGEDDFVEEYYCVAGNHCKYLCIPELIYQLV